ncbi:MAG TPA: aspartate/glutamate racemase family protein [Clostridia bacterium]|nr:aspartate/glutamate racemase family protein [Clostridia bacterium]
MRLRIISAVPREKERREEYLPYLRRTLRADTRLESDGVAYGFPSVECDLHGMVNGAEVIDCVVRAQEEGADGAFVNCFDDPGVYAARELVRIPVFGGYQPAILIAMSLADRVGVITTDAAGILSEQRKARQSGFSERVASIRAVNFGVLSMDANLALLAQRITEACVDMYEKDRVGALTLGCTGMHNAVGAVRENLKKLRCPVTVIEPLQNGVNFLENAVLQGYTNALGVIDNIDAWKRR